MKIIQTAKAPENTVLLLFSKIISWAVAAVTKMIGEHIIFLSIITSVLGARQLLVVLSCFS